MNNSTGPLDTQGGKRRLKQYYQDLFDTFEANNTQCTCHISPPCGHCLEKGNPNNLNEDDNAWEADPDFHIVPNPETQGTFVETTEKLVAYENLLNGMLSLGAEPSDIKVCPRMAFEKLFAKHRQEHRKVEQTLKQQLDHCNELRTRMADSLKSVVDVFDPREAITFTGDYGMYARSFLNIYIARVKERDELIAGLKVRLAAMENNPHPISKLVDTLSESIKKSDEDQTWMKKVSEIHAGEIAERDAAISALQGNLRTLRYQVSKVREAVKDDI